MTIRTKPSPTARARSPLDVSSAIAVVIVRVKPSILPPTIMMAPTSAAARPNPASSATTRGKARVPDQGRDARERPDIHRRQLVAIFRPQVLDRPASERGGDR